MKLQLISLLMCLSAAASAQDFFGKTAPKPQPKRQVVSLPDKPNMVDEQGRKQGEWAKKYPNGRYMYEATFVDDKPQGTMRRYYDNGRESSVLTYLAPGKYMAQLYSEDGKKEAEGVFEGEKREGQWTLYADNGSVVGTEWYVGGVLEGEAKTYYENGATQSEVTYKAGMKEGVEMEYYKTGGKRRLTMYIHGRKHGDYRFWDDGSRATVEGRYNMDTPVGDWKMYDSEAREYYTLHYDAHGKLLNEAEINERQQREYERHERERQHLQDPEHYVNRPEEYRP